MTRVFPLHTPQSETAREFVKKNAREAAGSMPKIKAKLAEIWGDEVP